MGGDADPPEDGGLERRVYALIASLPFSGAQTAHFSFDMTIESFLEGHVRVFEWLGGVPRECVYDNLRSVGRQARQPPGGPLESAVPAFAWPLRVSLDRVHAGDAAGEGLGRGSRPLSEDGVLAGAAVRRRCPSSTWSMRDWRDQVAHRRRHATGRFIVAERLEEERAGVPAAAAGAFDFSLNRTVRVPLDGYLRYGGCFYRAPIELVHQRVELQPPATGLDLLARQRGRRLRAQLSAGVWLPEPRMRPEPPPTAGAGAIAAATVEAPELADYAEFCA